MTIYMGAILLTELLMLTMIFHVLHYPGFTRVEKRWYLFTFVAIFLCAGAECVSVHLDGRGPAYALPLTILDTLQFSICPMLPALFVGALGMYRQAIVAGTVCCVHALAELVSAPFGWIFYYDPMGNYVRGDYYFIYESVYILSLAFLIVCLIAAGNRFKKRDLSTILMVFVIMAAAIVPLVLFKVYTNYVGIGVSAALCYIYYNDLIQEDNVAKLLADQETLSVMQEHTITGMANLIESRGLSDGERVKRTGRTVRTLAECARRDGVYADALDDRFISTLSMMAPMYDVGKIVVPDDILTKPGRVTKAEFEQIKRHASEGGRIVREVLGGVAEADFVAMASDLATHHHERWDGRGYPAGLSGEAIPLSARLMAVADVYDALVSERCYKEPVLRERAFEIIRQEAGAQFDPRLAGVFWAHREEF